MCRLMLSGRSRKCLRDQDAVSVPGPGCVWEAHDGKGAGSAMAHERVNWVDAMRAITAKSGKRRPLQARQES